MGEGSNFHEYKKDQNINSLLPVYALKIGR